MFAQKRMPRTMHQTRELRVLFLQPRLQLEKILAVLSCDLNTGRLDVKAGNKQCTGKHIHAVQNCTTTR